MTLLTRLIVQTDGNLELVKRALWNQYLSDGSEATLKAFEEVQRMLAEKEKETITYNI